MGFLISPHPLANFEIEKYYQKEPRFNEVFSRDNLPNKMVGAYVIKLDEYTDFSLFCKKKKIVCFDSFGVEYVPQEI